MNKRALEADLSVGKGSASIIAGGFKKRVKLSAPNSSFVP